MLRRLSLTLGLQPNAGGTHMASEGDTDDHKNSSGHSDSEDFSDYDSGDDYTDDEFEENDRKRTRSWFGTFCFVFRHSFNLGTVWRLPALLCKYGDVCSFLLAYGFMLILIGLPLCCLDLALGQCSGLGAVRVWKITKITTGVGYAVGCLNAGLTVYVNIVVSWSFYYFFAAIQNQLPCTSCDYFYNCKTNTTFNYFFDNCSSNGNSAFQNVTFDLNDNATLFGADAFSSTSVLFFEKTMLNLQNKGNDGYSLGSVRWPLVLCLFFTWVLSYVGLIKGIQKVAFTGGIIVLAITSFAVAVCNDNRIDSLQMFFKPTFNKLADLSMWHDAATQVLFSLGPSFGWLINYSSHKHYRGGCYTDNFLLVGGNAVVTIWITVSTFILIGSPSYLHNFQAGLNEEEGFVFVGMSSILSQLPGSVTTTSLFFLGVGFLGIAFNVSLVKVIYHWLKAFHIKMTQLKKRLFAAALVCIVLFGLGCTLATSGGYFLIGVFDKYFLGWSSILIALTECVIIGWLYGGQKLASNIEVKTAQHSRLPYFIMWEYVTPLVLLLMFLFKWAANPGDGIEEIRYSTLVGRILSSLPFFIIIIYAGVLVFKDCYRDKKDLASLFRPSGDWVPDENNPVYSAILSDGRYIRSPPEPFILVEIEDPAYGNIPYGFFFNPAKRRNLNHVLQAHDLGLMPNGDEQSPSPGFEDKLHDGLVMGNFKDRFSRFRLSGRSASSLSPLMTPNGSCKDGFPTPIIIARRMPFPSILTTDNLPALNSPSPFSSTRRSRSMRGSMRTMRRSKSSNDCPSLAIVGTKEGTLGSELRTPDSPKESGSSDPSRKFIFPSVSQHGVINPSFVIEEYP